MARRSRVALASAGLMLLLAGSLAACSRKLTKDDCAHLLGRGVGLVAYANTDVVPVDVDDLHRRARGEVKKAIDEFDAACVGGVDDDQAMCARRSKSAQDFGACGPLTKKALQTGELAQLAVPKKHGTDECAKYADHGVRLGVAKAEDVGKLVRSCDDWMEVGVYRCRLAAKDGAAWKACE